MKSFAFETSGEMQLEKLIWFCSSDGDMIKRAFVSQAVFVRKFSIFPTWLIFKYSHLLVQ